MHNVQLLDAMYITRTVFLCRQGSSLDHACSLVLVAGATCRDMRSPLTMSGGCL